MSDMPTFADPVDSLREKLRGRTTVRHSGRVVRAVGTSIRASGLPARIGQRCRIGNPHSDKFILADIVGVDHGDALLIPLGTIDGVAVDSEVQIVSEQATVPYGKQLLGHIVDGFGQPLDEFNDSECMPRRPIDAPAPNPLNRLRIDTSLETGVRAIDTLLTVGVGQRLGIFAPAGAGKSSLLGMIASSCKADVIVIGLIGERGREVREFIEDNLGEAGKARSVIVVSTSDRPAMERVSAARTATAIAEGFREQGLNVLLLMDSITRYARALREVGLAVGEPPVRQGFTPSVFADLPRLFERSGNNHCGSITAFYTILTDGDDGLDPIAEETRSILDGHIVLSRKLAEQGHFPAIDVLASISRLATQLLSSVQKEKARQLRTLLAKYQEVEFLVQVGEYKTGSDPLADTAIEHRTAIAGFLQQTVSERTSANDSWEQLNLAMGVSG